MDGVEASRIIEATLKEISKQHGIELTTLSEAHRPILMALREEVAGKLAIAEKRRNSYWIVMITLFVVVAVFLFWLGIFVKAFGDLYVGGLCSVFARGLRFDCLGCVVKKTS